MTDSGASLHVLRHEPSSAPAVCEKCGRRHPALWIHSDESKCSQCGEIKAKREFGYKAILCKSCCAAMGIKA